MRDLILTGCYDRTNSANGRNFWFSPTGGEFKSMLNRYCRLENASLNISIEAYGSSQLASSEEASYQEHQPLCQLRPSSGSRPDSRGVRPSLEIRLGPPPQQSQREREDLCTAPVTGAFPFGRNAATPQGCSPFRNRVDVDAQLGSGDGCLRADHGATH